MADQGIRRKGDLVATIARLRSRLTWCDRMVLYSRVPPGYHGPKLHTHSVDQIYFVVSGSMRVQVGTQVSTVMVLIPAGTPHCNWNDGTEDEQHQFGCRIRMRTEAPCWASRLRFFRAAEKSFL
jgi:Cupin domain